MTGLTYKVNRIFDRPNLTPDIKKGRIIGLLQLSLLFLIGLLKKKLAKGILTENLAISPSGKETLLPFSDFN